MSAAFKVEHLTTGAVVSASPEAPEPQPHTVPSGPLKAVLGAACTDPRRESICGVHVTSEGVIEATDGHRLNRWTPAELRPGTTPRILGTASLDAAVKAAGKKGSVTLGETTAQSGAATFALEIMEGEFPNVAQVMPKGPFTFEIRLNARYLRDLADAALQVNPSARQPMVRLQFSDALSPVLATSECEDGTLETVLMPMHP